MRNILGRLLRWFVYLAAAGVMLLALLVGVARLLLPQVPEYQNEIRRWARDATGFDIQFEYISASWPFAGPELKFFDVTISSPDTEQPILDANYLTVGISLLRFLIDREIVVDRIAVGGSQVTIQNDPGGTVLVQGRALEQLFSFQTRAEEFSIPEVVIRLDDISLSYDDSGRTDQMLGFFVEQLELRLSDSGVALDGAVQLADVIGTHAEFSLDLPAEILRPGADGEDRELIWNGYVAVDNLQVDQMLELWLNMDVPLRQTYGDVVVWAEFAGLTLVNATIELDLENLELEGANGEAETYDAVIGQLEWGRNDDGWILGGSDLEIKRNNHVWPESEFTVVYRLDEDGESRHITGKADFLRLHDLYPIILSVASADVRDSFLPPDIRGDITNLDLDLWLVENRPLRFNLEMQFEDLGITIEADGESITGISGSVVADQLGGRLQIQSTDSEFVLPQFFQRPIETESIEGFFVWRVTENQVRILSDNIRIRAPYLIANSRFELNVPRNGDSPRIDLTAFATVSDVRQALNYLPMRKFKPKFASWLERSIVAGRVTGAQLQLSGALHEFPYDHGEGVFRIVADCEEGILDYAKGWPRIEDVTAQIVFDGMSLEVKRNRARVAGISVRGAQARIDDLRQGRLEISARQSVGFDQMLTFLRATPVGDAMGPVLAEVQGRGTLDSKLRLTLPIKSPTEYELRVEIVTKDADVGLKGLDFGFTDLAGTIRVENRKVYADDLTARLLDEPVTIKVRPTADEYGLYTHFASVTGSTPVDRWMQALKLPFPERIDGRVSWNAMALIPARREEGTAPLHVLARSDLVGVESVLPMPLHKVADTTAPFEIDIAFPEEGVLEMTGRMREEISWALRLEAVDDRWAIARGAVHAGSARALLPAEPGVTLSGRLAKLRLDDWLALTDGESESPWMELYREADLNIGRLYAFGRSFPDVEIGARRDGTEWRISLESPYVAGTINLPLSPSASAPMRIELTRLWLIEDDPVETGSKDPRDILPFTIQVDDFMLGEMRFGSLNAELSKASYGVLIDPIQTRAAPFQINGSAAWFVHPNDETIQQSQLRFALAGDDIKGTLLHLGYDPVIEGKVARVNTDLTWPGPPSGDFLDHANGTLNVLMEDGALLQLEPGGGRLLGVLSVAALPRRLSLDFSDVFDEGLGFDKLQGDFILNNGNAYTCNLSLEGSVADLGIVGRAGIATEDYDQLAVVRPHVSNVLAIGGTVVGGPAVGAAMLLFAEIFKKPLSTLGESYYHVAGSWEDPEITRLQGDELDLEPIRNCEQNMAAEVQRLSPE